MADFVKKTWACGDSITADELNRLEGGVEEALDKGYSCTETTTLLTDESVTTSKPEGFPLDIYSGQLSIENINAPSIRVTFNGTSYICERIGESYGAQGSSDSKDWSQYPFSISNAGEIQTESAGTYSVKIEAVEDSVETSECFSKAVMSASSLIVKSSETLDGTTMSETWQTIHDAIARGVHVVFVYDEGVYTITSAIKYDLANYAVLVTGLSGNVPTVARYLTTSADGYPVIVD